MTDVPTRILIVEDNAFIAASMEAMVHELGHWVIGPDFTLHDGLRHAGEDAIDFALLDFDLGHGTDATPIAEKLTARGISFAFATGSDPALICRAFCNVAIIAKPIDERTLRRVLPN